MLQQRRSRARARRGRNLWLQLRSTVTAALGSERGRTATVAESTELKQRHCSVDCINSMKTHIMRATMNELFQEICFKQYLIIHNVFSVLIHQKNGSDLELRNAPIQLLKHLGPDTAIFKY